VSLSLDHVVLLVDDLKKATADFRSLGFTVVNGGDHSGGATHNALVIFEDGTYLELIAYKRPAPEARWWQAGARSGEGLVDYALLPDNISNVIEEAGRRGLALDGPNEGARQRPDGVRLEWQTSRAATTDVPFLCGDITPRDRRVPEGDVRRHANGTVAIVAVTVAVTNLTVSAQRYGALLADTFHPLILAGLGIQYASIRLGNVVVNLAAPLPGAGAGAATLRHHLDRRGEGPYALAFAVRAGCKEGPIDRSLTHGAHLELIANSK